MSATDEISPAPFKTEHSPELATYYADRTHASWLHDPKNSYWAWSDQIVSGRAQRSKYYPRGVTSILWIKECRNA